MSLEDHCLPVNLGTWQPNEICRDYRDCSSAATEMQCAFGLTVGRLYEKSAREIAKDSWHRLSPRRRGFGMVGDASRVAIRLTKDGRQTKTCVIPACGCMCLVTMILIGLGELNSTPHGPGVFAV